MRPTRPIPPRPEPSSIFDIRGGDAMHEEYSVPGYPEWQVIRFGESVADWRYWLCRYRRQILRVPDAGAPRHSSTALIEAVRRVLP